MATILKIQHQKSKPGSKPKTCRHCGANPSLSGFTHFSDSSTCALCGRSQSDISTFYIVHMRSGRLASPQFATANEAQQFSAIFGMTSENGYALLEQRHRVDSLDIEKDRECKEEILEILAKIQWGKWVLRELKNKRVREEYPGEAGLLRFVESLPLKHLYLPICRVSAGGAA